MNEQKFHLGIKALIENDGKILILKSNTANLKINKTVHWDLPGGRIHKDDTVENTLLREVEEELGTRNIEIKEQFDSFISNIKFPAADGEIVALILFVYKCNLKNHDEKFVLSEEHTELMWAEPKDAAKLLEYKYPKSFTEKIKLL